TPTTKVRQPWSGPATHREAERRSDRRGKDNDMRHIRLGLVVLALLIGSGVTPASAAPPTQTPAPVPISTSDVSFVGSGGTVLHGSLVAPQSTGATRRPALVMLQGAGNRDRKERLPEAEALARHGIVVLLYDKRTDGYSLLHRD